MKLLLDSSVNVRKDNILELIIQNDSIHRASNYNVVKKKLCYFRKYDCQECNISTYDEDNILTCPDEKNTI
jgi:hypothetical protein